MTRAPTAPRQAQPRPRMGTVLLFVLVVAAAVIFIGFVAVAFGWISSTCSCVPLPSPLASALPFASP